MLQTLVLTILGLCGSSLAAEHLVTVGGPGGVVAFNPTAVAAAVGDTITFTFQQKNHTITQSSFENPCTPSNGGFDSGFFPVDANNLAGPFPTATLTVQTTDPIWVFCRQQIPASHCAAGMVFAINPADGQFEAFQAAAKATGNTNTTNSTSQSTQTTLTPAPVSTTEASAPSAAPTDHKVLVGDGGSLSFNPSNLSAQVGDTITFEFRAKNHTITQSTFNSPCSLLGASSGVPGFDSGFMPITAGNTSFPTYTIRVNDTNPIWAYCRQKIPVSHCASGMVFAANVDNNGANNFDAFVALAKAQNDTTGTNATVAPSGNKSDASPAIHLCSRSLVVIFALGLGLALA